MSTTDAELRNPSLPMRLRNARRDRGLTQESAASELGLARTSLVALEKGERAVRPEELVAMARLYGRHVDELLRPSRPVEDFVGQFRTSLSRTSTPRNSRMPSATSSATPRTIASSSDWLALPRVSSTQRRTRSMEFRQVPRRRRLRLRSGTAWELVRARCRTSARSLRRRSGSVCSSWSCRRGSRASSRSRRRSAHASQ